MSSFAAFIPSTHLSTSTSVTIGSALLSSFVCSTCSNNKRLRSTPCSRHRRHVVMSTDNDPSSNKLTNTTNNNKNDISNTTNSASESNGTSSPTSSNSDFTVNSNKNNDNNNNNTDNVTTSPPKDVVPVTLGNFHLSVPARSLLYAVPFLWGSFAPAVRFLFAQNPHQEASVFNSERLLLSTLVYVPVLWREVQALMSLSKTSSSTSTSSTSTTTTSSSSSLPSPSPPSSTTTPTSPPSSSSSTRAPKSSSSISHTESKVDSPQQTPNEIYCVDEGKGYSKSNRFDFFPKGVELGVYVFIANIAQVLGLQQTSASRASFLVQLQTVFVPILGTFLGVDQISFTTGLSSIIAIFGVALLSSDKGAGTESSLTGDTLEILSALFFSLYIVRLSRVANRVAPNPLVATKIAVQAILSIIWATATELYQSQSQQLSSSSSSSALVAVAVAPHAPWTLATISIGIATILWTGLFTSALSGWAQTKGQQAVPASEAALIFATQPLWATAIAAVALGEKFGSRGVAGGAFIVVATLVPTLADSIPFFKNRSSKEKKDKKER